MLGVSPSCQIGLFLVVNRELFWSVLSFICTVMKFVSSLCVIRWWKSREERNYECVRVDIYANTWHIKERVIHIGDAMRVCTLVSKLCAVNTEGLFRFRAFYLGMIEYDKGMSSVCLISSVWVLSFI